MGKGDKLPVSERALVQRINRKLRGQDEMLRRGRHRLPERTWCRIDFNRNFFLEENVDLEELGRELGVLKGYERLVEA